MSSRQPSAREPPGPDLEHRLRRYAAEMKSLVARNERHHEVLEHVEHRISISGTRGKSTLARWLHDQLVDREFDTYAKITGDHPVSMYNGLEWVIPRGEAVRIYENERQIRRFSPMEAMVIENQGISAYTTRLVNTLYVDPTLTAVTNVREDHLDTLGENREQVARSLARSIPEDALVICGEQNPTLRDYFATELHRRNSDVRYVNVPTEYANVPGAEIVFLLDEVLREIDGTGLRSEQAEEYLSLLDVDWTTLQDGRIFNASTVNDVQSTEAIRRALLGHSGTIITPFLYLRRDRPGRTASFARYLEFLAEDDLIGTVHVANGHATPFDRMTSFPVEIHDEDADPETVLSTLLKEDHPVMLMGNATPEFMRRLDDLIEEQAIAAAQALDAEDDGAVLDDRDGKQVLVLQNQLDEASDRVCLDLLTEPEPDRCVFCGIEESPRQQLDRWQRHGPSASDADPQVISATATTRSATDTANSGGSLGPDARIRPVDDVTDLVNRIESLVLENPVPGSVSLCFDSVGRLVEENSLEDAFRILFALTTELEQAGINAHYHFSTVGLDEQDVRTIMELFGTVMTVNEDGDVRVNDSLDL